MCAYDDLLPVTLNRPRPVSGLTQIMVDRCIAEEVQRLNDAGVWTLSCCCGHGYAPTSILVHASSLDQCTALGYAPAVYDGRPDTLELYPGALPGQPPRSRLTYRCNGDGATHD